MHFSGLKNWEITSVLNKAICYDKFWPRYLTYREAAEGGAEFYSLRSLAFSFAANFSLADIVREIGQKFLQRKLKKTQNYVLLTLRRQMGALCKTFAG